MRIEAARAVGIFVAMVFAACSSDAPGDGPAGGSCASPSMVCGGACIDVRSDPRNCGACGKTCDDALVCVSGRCSGACPASQEVCDGRCVATQTDRANCGACGNACASGQVCSEGACAVSCSARLLECSAASERYCADAKTDSTNCGTCGNACPAGEVCVDGACESWCGVGLSECNGICVDKRTDRVNCGSCGSLCGPGEVCSAGKCQFQCGPGLTNCGGVCRDLQIDPAHCGACDSTPCVSGEVCSAGKCSLTCGVGQKICGGACRDVSTDEAHCGACGVACTAGQYCKSGACVNVPCPAGTHVCAGICASDFDPKTCGTSCAACTPPANATSTCDGTKCGFACNTGFALSGGACVPEATAIAAPRLLSPLSTSVVSSLRPKLQWVLAAGTDGARVEICTDRACGAVVQTFDVVGNSGAPPVDLATSPTVVYFWRVYGKTGSVVGSKPSVTFELIIKVKTATSGLSTSWGSMLDLNGDGFADVAVGTPASNTVSIFPGGAAGVATTPSATIAGATASKAGTSVASAGDIDGDGYPDLIVGAPGTSSIAIHGGGPTGVGATARQTIAGTGQFGAAVAGAGDVNGDGYADVIVGAADTNAFFVYFGAPSGLGTTPTKVTGAAGSQLGTSVWAAGDVNGDGFGDVIAGAPGANAAYVHLGSKTGLSATPATTLTGSSTSRLGASVSGAFDTNGDGYCDVIVGAPGAKTVFVHAGSAAGVPTAATWTISSTLAGYAGSVAALMDVDYEGSDDMIVGTDANEAWIYLGNTAGPGQRPGWNLQVAAPTGVTGYGKVVASAGYVNGDRFAEALVGAPASQRVDVIFGSNSGWSSLTALGGATGFGSAIALRATAWRLLHG
ncbi:MAG: VCBS repeat-containing protein [Deltaproteobacteria bacterium]|nr:VCBS repeat-containing protein [Deltaproteobacteria bacterium]